MRSEETTVWRMFKAVDDARQGRQVLQSPTPDSKIEEIIARTWASREEAPSLAVPQLGGPLAYWAARMRRNGSLVAVFAEFVSEAELDAIAYPHPISGPFTMRQGFEFIRFHIDRHHGHLLSLAHLPKTGSQL